MQQQARSQQVPERVTQLLLTRVAALLQYHPCAPYQFSRKLRSELTTRQEGRLTPGRGRKLRPAQRQHPSRQPVQLTANGQRM